MRPLPPLSAEVFSQHATCPNWPYWDLFGDPSKKAEVPPLFVKLREARALHERRIAAALEGMEEIAQTGKAAERFSATLAAMRRGAAAIYRGTLVSEDWVGHPDLLVRVDGASRLGDWHYEAVEITSARQVRDAHRLRLVFYALLLKSAQDRKPDEGRVIAIDGSRLSFPIEESEAEFFRALDEILAIRAGEKPEALFTSGCKASPWYQECRREVEAADDIGLLYKIYKSEYRRLRAAGYATVQALAAEDLARLQSGVTGVSDHRLERLQLQAQSMRDKKALRLGAAGLPDADVELFYDIEGDPTIGLEYLHGMLVREGGRETYRSFFANRPEEEGAAWTAFCDAVEAYAGAPVYHYGWYEREAVRRLSATYGISPRAAGVLGADRMIDLNRVVQRTAILPLPFYSLKDVAGHLGFRWRAADASGANSVAWFQDWREKGDPDLMQKILAYNEDDVRAAAVLKDWLVGTG